MLQAEEISNLRSQLTLMNEERNRSLVGIGIGAAIGAAAAMTAPVATAAMTGAAAATAMTGTAATAAMAGNAAGAAMTGASISTGVAIANSLLPIGYWNYSS